jgi:K+-transporting ATPase c subunit
MVLVFTIVLGMTYGLLIELITSVVFRLRSQ